MRLIYSSMKEGGGVHTGIIVVYIFEEIVCASGCWYLVDWVDVDYMKVHDFYRICIYGARFM